MLSELAKDRHSHLFQNAEIIQFYGTSETSFITLTDSNTPEGSVGRPYPAVQLRLSGVEQFSGSGEVCVQSPYLFDGYVDYVGPNGTENDGFFRTGEVGYQDTEGYLFLKGRVDRMVTISDVNVHPEAIETAVSSLAYVDACAVVTKPDEKRGHRAVCFIVSQSLDGTPAKIRQHCRSVLGACYVPKEVRIISELPMLASGKPDLRALTKQIADL
jgi:long-chain acyl-CoA synthetase